MSMQEDIVEMGIYYKTIEIELVILLHWKLENIHYKGKINLGKVIYRLRIFD